MKVILFALLGIFLFVSSPAFAEPGDLLLTIENPGLKKDMFSSSLATLDDFIIVGASGKEVNGIAGAGSLYVFDGFTGELKFTIDNPNPKHGDGFGRHMITTDNYIVVGLDVDDKRDIGHKGKIFVFDRTGSLHHTIEHPNGLIYDEWFADQIDSYGDNIISGSNFQVSDKGWIYAVYVFDESGKIEHTLTNSESETNTFGYSTSSFGDNIAIYAIDDDANDDVHTNSIHVFDASTGILQFIIENPDPTKGDFGRHIVEIQDNLAVGIPTNMFNEQISGIIHVFDSKGQMSFSIPYPESDTTNAGFGGYLTAVGNNIALRSVSDQIDHDSMLPLSDVFYVFDGKSGKKLLMIEEAGLQDQNSRSFIEYINKNGNLVISGINRNDHNPLQKTVYVFEGVTSEAVLDDISKDDTPFFGIFVFFEKLFSWVMQPTQENNTMSEQEIHQLIQNEISKSPKITGVLAQDVCTILSLECTSQTSFNAVFDPTDGYTKFSHSRDSVDYFFRTADDMLEYRTGDSAEWRTLEDDFTDTFGWGDSLLEKKEVVDDNRSHTFYFDSDKLGNYEKWCSMYNGTFHSNVMDSKVGCEFATKNDSDIARDGLREFQKKTISGELAQKLCRAYGKVCAPGIFITMEYDMETGELYKLKKLDNPTSDHYYTEYRIIDEDVIQYRIPTHPPQPWMTFEE